VRERSGKGKKQFEKAIPFYQSSLKIDDDDYKLLCTVCWKECDRIYHRVNNWTIVL